METGAKDDRTEFGCGRCFAGDAGEALGRLKEHEDLARLVDEVHFIVRIVRCRSCGQQFLSIFCESVDWFDGEDPQSRVLLPLRPDEAETLSRGGEDVDFRFVHAIGDGRRHLFMDWPSKGQKQVEWRDGEIVIAPHD